MKLKAKNKKSKRTIERKAQTKLTGSIRRVLRSTTSNLSTSFHEKTYESRPQTTAAVQTVYQTFSL